MQRFFSNIFFSLKLPEMRGFWALLPFVIVAGILSTVYLPSAILVAISLGSLFFILFLVFFVNLRLATANSEIKIERNEMSGIISNLGDGIIAYDSNFRILIFNKSAERIFGIQAVDVIGSYFTPEKAKNPSFSVLVQVLFPSLAPTVMRRSEEGKFPYVVDMSFSEPKTELRVITDRIVDPKGVLLGFVKIIHDRTRELQILKSKNEFIEVAAHQLRTPLTSIHWVFESLKKDQLAPGQVDLVEAGLGASVNVLKTVNDLLDVSKIEDGKYGYQFENVEFISFVESVLGELVAEAKSTGIKLYFKRPAEKSLQLTIDSQKMAMVIYNLVSNAIKYNVESGEVFVGVRVLEGQPFVEVSVKDTGIGVPAEDINNLFTKFFRADNAQKAVTDGIGLGLYIVKNIVKRHGGEIWAESQLNRGTTFYFTIPTDQRFIPATEKAWEEE